MNLNLKLEIIRKYGSQADFAHALGISDAVVSRVIRGRRILKNDERQRWASALQGTPDDVFGNSKINNS